MTVVVAAAAERTWTQGLLRSFDAARQEAAVVVADLERELEAIARSTDANVDDEHDAEGSTVGYERARVGALLAAARQRLARLDRALARARRGETVRCERCGCPIAAERLEALPGTARCVRCSCLAAADVRLQPWPGRAISRPR